MNQVAEAFEMFQSIPARIRALFDNSPQKFLEFAQNPKNADKMVELGLAQKRPVDPPIDQAGREASENPPAASEGA